MTKNIYNISFGGVMSALSVTVMFMSTLIPAAAVSVVMPIAAAVILAIVADQCGLGLAVLVYLSVSILSLLLLPTKGNAFTYLFMFGPFTILRLLTDRFSLILKYILKILIMNILVSLYYFYMIFLGFIIIQRVTMLLTWFLSWNVILMICDYFLIRFAKIYKRRFSVTKS